MEFQTSTDRHRFRSLRPNLPIFTAFQRRWQFWFIRYYWYGGIRLHQFHLFQELEMINNKSNQKIQKLSSQTAFLYAFDNLFLCFFSHDCFEFSYSAFEFSIIFDVN